MSGWIDISVPLRNGMPHWPGDKPFELVRDMDMASGDGANLSSLSTSAHVGTHMDAPRHFVASGESIDRIPFDAVMGRARVIPIRNPDQITAGELRPYDLREGERVLLKTRNSQADWMASGFIPDFVSVAPDAAEYLAERRVRLLGVDYLSVGAYNKGEQGSQVHRILLGAGIWIIEGLCLRDVEPGEYELICLPLKIENAEGAPARAILRRV